MNRIKHQEHPELFSEAKPLEELDLLARHDLYFETCAANTPALINTAHALRFQVYCLERKFEKTEEHAGGMEVDAFDSHSTHGLLIYRSTGEALGTVRVISPSNGSTRDNLPIINLLRDNNIDLTEYLPIEHTVEISRFAISKQLRRRLTDQYESSGIATPKSRLERERFGNLPCLSLMQFIVRQSLALGATHWAAVMEVKLLRMFASMGIYFQPIGPIVLHHGLRQPCYGNIAEVLENIKREHYDYWSVITNAGELVDKMKPAREISFALA
jgi:N-acyl amino acid synthase of PEP-CTERM/exosortase system